MASERQIAANRRNGSLGGPKTEDGKAKAAANSTKHGLTGTKVIVMRDESQDEYQEILQGFRKSFEPDNPMEEALVERLAHAQWRTLRSRSVETEMLRIAGDIEKAYARKIVENCPESLSPHGALATSFLKNPEDKWKTYMRYDGAISREFFKTLDALHRMQKERKRNAPPPQQSKPLVMAAGASTAQVSENGIRSVSQTSPKATNTNEKKELTPQTVEASDQSAAGPNNSVPNNRDRHEQAG